MSELDMHVHMDAAALPLDLANAPLDIITIVLQSISLEERFTCALVCKAWAEAATAATRSIILRHRMEDLSCLQRWMEKHGKQLKVLQLHECGGAADLAALPCEKLQDLLLHGSLSISSSVWDDLAAATKLASVSLRFVQTASQQADVVSALTALPDLQQLTWCAVGCGGEGELSDSLTFQQLTQITSLEIQHVASERIQDLGSLTKLQHLGIDTLEVWDAAGCSGLQELKALTSLYLCFVDDIPAGISQLTALQELALVGATLASVTELQALTGLTQLCLHHITGSPPESATLQLPSLRHLTLHCGRNAVLPASFLCECTQLHVLSIQHFPITGPGSLVASTMLQQLVLRDCSINTDDEAEHPGSWQQVFSGPGQLPHLTWLHVSDESPELQPTDIEDMAACCSSLQVLFLDNLPDSVTTALAHLPGLTSLHLHTANDQDCSSLAQLTGLRELKVDCPREVSTVGLRQLAALEQLTCLEFVDDFDPNKVSPVLQEQMSRVIISKAPAGQPPDVSARLLQTSDMADDGDS